jgi:predicted small lipoprotein YifL
MPRMVCIGIVLAIVFGSVLGCGKSDPPPQEGVNPFEKKWPEQKGQKDKKEQKNPMIPD